MEDREYQEITDFDLEGAGGERRIDRKDVCRDVDLDRGERLWADLMNCWPTDWFLLEEMERRFSLVTAG